MKAQERAQTTDVVWRSGWHWPDLGRVKALMIWPCQIKCRLRPQSIGSLRYLHHLIWKLQATSIAQP